MTDYLVDVKNEVDQVNNALKQVLTGVELPKLLRAPGGYFPANPIKGYEDWYYYGWDIPPERGSSPPSADVIRNLLDDLRTQGYPDSPIILLHSIKMETLFAVTDPQYDMLSRLEELGYTRFEKLPRPGDRPGYPWIGKVPIFEN
jgi:hypothetical protein